MAVPKFYEFFGVILEFLQDKTNKTRKEVRDYCATKMKLLKEDLIETIPSGQNKFLNRTNWACSYLKTSGLVESGLKKGDLVITQEGLKAIEECNGVITLNYVQSSEKFKTHQEILANGNNTNDGDGKNSGDDITEVYDPIEQIDKSLKELNESLVDELLEEVKKLLPVQFEKLILKLLKAMGYGDFQMTKVSCDEGIDGVVYEDEFRFYSVYTQAKQWKKPNQIVGRPEIQKFLGALAGQGATRGIFITTARFSVDAHEFVNKQLNHKIRLVEGRELAHFMIQYNVGVNIENTYVVKKMDSDFFINEL